MNACQNCGEALPPSRGPKPRKWCSERCRKVGNYGRPCPECGTTMNASDPGKSKVCSACHLRAYHEDRMWTPELVLESIQRLSENGEPPTVRKVMEQRSSLYTSACREFGSWKAAVTAAGFTPRGHGCRYDRETWLRNLRAAKGKRAA